VGQRLHADQCVGRLVIAEQCHPSVLDRRQVVAPVTHHEDRDLGDLLRSRTGGSESTTDVAEYLASLDPEVTGTDELAVLILGLLPGDEDQFAAGPDDDVRVCRGSGQVFGLMSSSVIGGITALIALLRVAGVSSVQVVRPQAGRVASAARPRGYAGRGYACESAPHGWETSAAELEGLPVLRY